MLAIHLRPAFLDSYILSPAIIAHPRWPPANWIQCPALWAPSCLASLTNGVFATAVAKFDAPRHQPLPLVTLPSGTASMMLISVQVV